MAEPAQPPPSWAELNSRLAALLQRLEALTKHAERASLLDASSECAQWRADVEAAVAAARLGPAFDEREPLARWAG